MEKSAEKIKNEKPADTKSCESPNCSKPDCKNQDPAERGPGTRVDMSSHKEGTGCPQFEPKLFGTVNMGENAVIDLKIARTGVPGNKVRTDHAAAMLKHHMDQKLLDRTALEILRYYL